MYMCIPIHIWKYIYIYENIYIYVCIYIYMHICISMDKHIWGKTSAEMSTPMTWQSATPPLTMGLRARLRSVRVGNSAGNSDVW